MSFEEIKFTWAEGLLTFASAIGITLGIAFVASLVLSLVLYGGAGPGLMLKNVFRAGQDFVFLSCRRTWAIANLTIKESLRKKALFVFVVFAILFMFAGWFLGNAGPRSDLQMSVYVSFVFQTMTWLVLPVLLLLSCWGLPADIKARSLHTVTTKPVRKSEILIGRILGYVVVGTIILGLMGFVGYVWVVRQVPDSAASQLISRVPVYGELTFDDKFGSPATKGISVGDEWSFRSYLAGGTKARAKYDFSNLNVAALKADYKKRVASYESRLAVALEEEKKAVSEEEKKAATENVVEIEDEIKSIPAITLEYNFEAYRSQKGSLDRRLLCLITVENPETGDNAPLDSFEVMEYSQAVEDKSISIPAVIHYRDRDTAERREMNLFDGLIHKGRLRLEVECLDAHQYLGMATPDLFIRMPNKSFAVSFAKSVFGLWMQMFLIILLGVTASCFVKGPVASLLTFTLFLLGQAFRGIMDGLLTPVANLDGRTFNTIHGPFETMYRMYAHSAATRPIAVEPWVDIVWYYKQADQGVMAVLEVAKYIIPDFSRFNMNLYTAKGFDVPMEASMLPGIAISLAYIIPCLLLGYFSLQLREMEAK